MSTKVLIVEDDNDIRDSVIEYLEMIDFEVRGACNGKEALNILKDKRFLPQIILLDLMMPVMDGFQFRLAQKDDPAIKGIPVIIMSADGHVEEKKAKADACSYLKKPVDLDDLVASIHRHSQKNPA